MKAPRLRIDYDFSGMDAARREECRAAQKHDYPPGGAQDAEVPGTYTCRVCGTVKHVKEKVAPR